VSQRGLVRIGLVVLWAVSLLNYAVTHSALFLVASIVVIVLQVAGGHAASLTAAVRTLASRTCAFLGTSVTGPPGGSTLAVGGRRGRLDSVAGAAGPAAGPGV
jgi:hypothetical protein